MTKGKLLSLSEWFCKMMTELLTLQSDMVRARVLTSASVPCEKSGILGKLAFAMGLERQNVEKWM